MGQSSVHRADFLDALATRLPLGMTQFNKRATRVEHGTDSARVHFAYGTDFEADILIASDGIKSSLRDDVPEIIDIRGPGLMNAVEFNVAGTGKPSPEFTNKVREEALKRGLILLTCGVYGNVIRFLAPLTIPDDQFAQALDILEEAMLAARD